MTTHLAAAGTAPPLLSVEGLSIDLRLPGGTVRAVDDVTFDLPRGATLGIVGESGSGKSLTALSLMRMLPRAAQASHGRLTLDGDDLLAEDERRFARRRGSQIGMVFQDPLAYLNPLMRVGAQIAEVLRLHGTPRVVAEARAVELLAEVGVRDAERRARHYPHQFSGGMRQRVVIAMAIANRPDLIIADEPTTALDVTVQAEILRLLRGLQQQSGSSMILVTHDIAVVEETCESVLVMYAGRVVERGPTAQVLAEPRHPYTRELLRSSPRLDLPVQPRLPAIAGTAPDPAHRPTGCAFHTRCRLAMERCATELPPLTPSGVGTDAVAACWAPVEQVATLTVRDREPGDHASARPEGEPVLVVEGATLGYPVPGPWWRARRFEPVVPDLDLVARRGRVLGLVGESGSGKSTVARAMVGLLQPMSGTVSIDGVSWADADQTQRAQLRRTVQMVFQDPYQSLNPRHTIHDTLLEPLVVHRMREPGQQEARVRELLDLAGLSSGLLDRYPYQLSGGQRQRVGIARALAVEPTLVVADEPVSALDVSVQAQIVNLMADLRDELGHGYVVIAHDLSVVRHLCDDVAVMDQGQIVERGPAREVLENPSHPYTRRLLAASPGSPWAADEQASAEEVAG